MANELLDCRTYAASADIFSLGLMIYELCFCNAPAVADPPPFELLPEGGDAWHLLRSLAAPLPVFRSSSLVEMVRLMIHPDVSQRPTAAAVLAAPTVVAAVTSTSVGDPVLLSARSFVPVSFRDMRSDSFEPLMALDA